MRIKKYKKSIISFIFLFSLLSFKLSIAQSGVSRFEAYVGTDADYSQAFNMPSAHKEGWHKFKVDTDIPKTISVTTKGLNPLNKIDLVKLYTGTSSNLQFIMDSSPILTSDSVVTIFLDSGIVAINDTIYLRLIKSTNSSCTNCQNNNPLNYLLEILPPDCGFAAINIDEHAPFPSSSCNVFTTGVACTLKVCSNEALCLRASFIENYHSFFMCGTGTVSMSPGISSSPIQYNTSLINGTYINSYCFTTGSTPGIYPVTVCWRLYPDDEDCSGGVEPDRFSNYCCGTFYIEIGATPPPSSAVYTAAPNPVCAGNSMCFTTNNTIGYSYFFDPGTSNANPSSPSISTDGISCWTYPYAGTYNTSLTVYNGYCPSPRITQTLQVFNPSVTGTVDKNNCRNYTLTANPLCLPNGVTYTWNVGGVTYTGSPVIVDLPGNSTSVPISLTASAPTLSPSVVWNYTITNVSNYSASITHISDGCGNVTYQATPSACVPADAIYSWLSFGATHYGNPFTVTLNAGATIVPNATLTVTNSTGTVLFTQIYNSQNVGTQGTLCCGVNTECVIGHVGGTAGRAESSCTQTPWNSNITLSGNQTFTDVAFTVAPNVTVTIAAGANITFLGCTFLMYEGSGFVLTRNASSLTYSYCYLHGCKKLWEGVRFKTAALGENAPGTRPIVKFENSMMEDAYIGFNFSNTPDFVDFRVFKSIFNKNIIGIKYINKPVDGALGAESKISVTESAFTCKEYNSLVNFAFYNGLTTYNAYLANALDEAPLTKVGIQYHPKSLVGISVEGKRECLGCNTYSPLSTYISVTEGLVYDNLVQGIAVKGLNLSNFKSNKFIKITSPISGGNYSNLYGTIATGIYYNGKSSTSTTNSSLSYQTIKVGATNPSASQRNKFTNCYYGVYAKDEAIDVTYNDFTNCYNGIYLGNANVPSNYNTITNATIKNNQFLRLKYTGFTLDKNLSINVEIDGNNINNNSAPNFTSRAVDIIEVNAPVAAKYSVKNNNFGKVWCGTRASGANNPIFTNNYILLNTSTTFNGVTVGSALYNTGIQVVNCEKPQVNENEIFNGNNFNTWWEQGIVVNDCENGSYYCNDVNGTFSSITTGGVCPGTLIYKNDFHNAKFAHWLIYANVIGYQYNPTLSSTGNLYPNPPSFVQPADNRYYGISPLHSYTQNGTNGQLNARFYVRGNNAVSPYALLNNGNEFSSSSSPIFFPTINNAVFAYTPAGCNSNGGGVPNGRLMSLAKEIAIDNLYQPGDARNRFVSRKKLLSNIQKDGITNTGDTDIDNFTASISNEPVAKFFNVDMLAQQGVENADSNYFVQANTLNESVVPADSIEMIQQYVNKGYIIYLKSGGNLDADIIAVLQPIAALCPYRYGTSIWQARALLVGFDNTEYFNDCEFYSAPDDLLSTARMAQVIDDVRDEETTSKLAIFPNPNTGDFKVELPNVNAEVTIDIVNTVGAVVKQMSHKVTENNTMIEIQDLTQGLYFVIVKQNGVTIGTNRVVVTK